MGAPENKAKQHERKAKNLVLRMEKIKARHPQINFQNKEFLSDARDYIKLRIQHIREVVDAEMCNSDNINRVCSNCTCLKSKR